MSIKDFAREPLLQRLVINAWPWLSQTRSLVEKGRDLVEIKYSSIQRAQRADKEGGVSFPWREREREADTQHVFGVSKVHGA